MKNIYAALEIGTTRTVLAIGEAEPGKRLKVSSHAEIASTGVRKSQIFDISQATQSVKSVIGEIERQQDEAGSRLTLVNTFLVINGQHVKATPAPGNAQIRDKVGADEMNEALRSSRSIPVPKDCELLDILDQDYVIDDRRCTFTPMGMSGRLLKLNALQILGDRSCIQDARTATEAAHLEIRDPLFATTCAADVVLEDREKANGALVVDLGGGSTGYAAYADGYVVSTGAIGVGGDHVTNDIVQAFQTTTPQAEALKTQEANAIVAGNAEASARVKVALGENPLMDNRTISRRALNTVVNARLLELFTVIRETLEDQDVLNRLHAGVVLTGGGARMAGIRELAAQAFGLPVRIGVPIQVDGLEDEQFPASFATIAGALLYASRNYEDRSILNGIFSRIFK